MPNLPDMAQVWRQMNWVLTKTFIDKSGTEAELKAMVNKAFESGSNESNQKAMTLQKRGMP